MAKRKDAVALFEVITATKRKEKEAAAAGPREPRQGLRGWLSRGKGGQGNGEEGQSPQAAAAPSRDNPTAGAVLSPAYVPVAHLASPSPVIEQHSQITGPAAATAVVELTPAAPAAAPAVVQRVMPAVYAEPQSIAVRIPSTESPRRPWFGSGVKKKIGLDPDRREVTLRFRYTTAVVAGFAVLVIVGLAYVAGRGNEGATAGPNSPSSEEIRRGEVLAGVLDVSADRTARIEPGNANPDATLPDAGAPPPPGAGVGNAKPPVTPRVSSVFEDGMPRVLGLNYVIIQTYPDRKEAEAAHKALRAGGIDSTVERVPKNWAANPNLWSVIGTRGFARIKSVPEFQAYNDEILKVSKTFAGASNYKKFAPAARKWQ